MKICTSCKEEKNEVEFHKHKKGASGLRSICKVCSHAQSRAYQIKNSEKTAAQKKAYRDKNPETEWAGHLMRSYGLTIKNRSEMELRQFGLCGVCFMPPNPLDSYKADRILHVDHDHVDGFKGLPPEEKRRHIRGLICGTDNRILGLAQNDSSRLRALADYLDAYADLDSNTQKYDRD